MVPTIRGKPLKNSVDNLEVPRAKNIEKPTMNISRVSNFTDFLDESIPIPINVEATPRRTAPATGSGIAAIKPAILPKKLKNSTITLDAIIK